jgi:hypothetical protein
MRLRVPSAVNSRRACRTKITLCLPYWKYYVQLYIHPGGFYQMLFITIIKHYDGPLMAGHMSQDPLTASRYRT